jgi:hypothetical protein
MAVAVAGALGAGLLPESVPPYLGLSPLALGLRAAWRLWRERHDQDHDVMTERVGPGALSVAAVTFANGGDNIGVYVPGFTQIQSRRTRYLRRRVPGPCRRLVRGRTLARHPADRRPCASAVGPPAAARGTDWPRSGHPHPRRRLRHRSSRMSRRGRSAPGVASVPAEAREQLWASTTYRGDARRTCIHRSGPSRGHRHERASLQPADHASYPVPTITLPPGRGSLSGYRGPLCPPPTPTARSALVSPIWLRRRRPVRTRR